MSSFSPSEGHARIIAKWESREQVYWSPLADSGSTVRPATVAPGTNTSKHPIILSNRKGNLLFAWTDGTGWQHGGPFSWQEYASDGYPVGERGHADGLPAWSLLGGYAWPDGGFVMLH